MIRNELAYPLLLTLENVVHPLKAAIQQPTSNTSFSLREQLDSLTWFSVLQLFILHLLIIIFLKLLSPWIYNQGNKYTNCVRLSCKGGCFFQSSCKKLCYAHLIGLIRTIWVSKESSFLILSANTYFLAKTATSSGLHQKLSETVGSI